MLMTPRAYWHLHHDKLWEFARDAIFVRREYIQNNKPLDEQPLRLRLLKRVRGTVPVDKAALKKYQDAVRKWRNAKRRLRRQRDLWTTWGQGRSVAEAEAEMWETQAECIIALQCLEGSVSKRAMNRLHREECPDCPWDGYSIFGERQQKRNGS